MNLFSTGFLTIAPVDDGTPTNSINIDSALTVGTSGEAWFVRLQALRGQSSATLTLYAYCTAVTGTPDFNLEVYSTSADAQRAAATAISSAPNTVNPTANTWDAYTCTVSLTQDVQYFFCLANRSGDPTTNHAAFRTRGALDAVLVVLVANLVNRVFVVGTTTDGFTTDPTLLDVQPACVIKYSDGTLQGNPYVVDDSAHASNQNNRGNRYTFTEDVSICGIMSGILGASAVDEYRIDTSAGVSVKTIASSFGGEENSGMGLCDPTTLSGGTTYDVTVGYASNSTTGTIYTMGETEGNVPTDVLACRPFSIAYVDGATPGSYTADTSKVMLASGLLVGDFPAISAGGSGFLIT